MSPKSLFSDDYVEARARFRNAASDAGFELEEQRIGQTGPGGDELTIDIAVAPGSEPTRTLVLSSGLHGAEGFFGSAIQLDALRDWRNRGRELTGLRLVMLHALNPYGFAWVRRSNETNVDLNRNFLLHGDQFRGSPPHYAALNPVLNPTYAPASWDPIMVRLLLAVARYGMRDFKQTVAEGQYEFPKGLFYGGSHPSTTSQILKTQLPRWLGAPDVVLHLDFHSGLGPWAHPKLLIDVPINEEQRRRLTLWFGPDSFEETVTAQTAYSVRGSMGRWCLDVNKGRDYTYAAVEYGTYHPIRVLAGLLRENQSHFFGNAGDIASQRSKQRLRELFCPRSEGWRKRVLASSRRIIDQAIVGLLS